MLYRVAVIFFSTLSALLFAAALAAYFWEPDAPGAVIDDVDREFPNLTVGAHDVRFKLHNPTQHPIRVVGYGTC